KIDNETDRDSDGVRMRWPHPKEGKMRKILLFIGILWTSIPALHAEGSFYTAREFVQMCELYDRYQSAGTDDSVEALRLGICLGYFRGVHVTYQLYELLSDRSQATTTRTATRRASALVCIPERATIKETVRVFLKYMKDHPEKLHEGADLMILEALAGAFPCKDLPCATLFRSKIDNETDRDGDDVRMRWPHPKDGKMRKILLLIGVLWTGAEALHAEG